MDISKQSTMALNTDESMDMSKSLSLMGTPSNNKSKDSVAKIEDLENLE